MRSRLSSACCLAVALSTGCYASHGRDARDGGIAPIDARPAVDADASRRVDARVACAEGDACDDGDACTTDDRCRAGVCIGTSRACESPPGACFAPTGTCEAGECVYGLADGVVCDDADACTTRDACAAGACRGEPLACDAPPSPECVDGTTLRTSEARVDCEAGICTYPHADRACPDGCVDGACRCIPSPWAVTVVEPRTRGGSGPGLDAIAIDESGDVHVVYPLSLPDSVVTMHYAHRSSDGLWHTELLGAGRYGTIRIAPDGTIHIAYLDPASALIHLESAAGESWRRSTVPAGEVGAMGSQFVMAIDGEGVVRVAFRGVAPDLAHAYRSTSGVWSTPEVVVVAAAYYPSAAAIDANGGFHVTFAGHLFEAHHAYRSPTGAWSSSAISPAPGGAFNDIEVGRGSGVHVLSTLARASGIEVVHAYRADPGAPWLLEDVGAAATHGASMALDAGGRAHVVFRVGTEWRERFVRHAWRDASGVWSVEDLSLPGLGSGGFSSSFVADREGGLHLVASTDDHALVYAYRRMCP